MKESAMIRTYRRRWLVLTPERLYSFKSERSYSNPTEEVDLKLCGTVKSADDLTNKQFTFTVQVRVPAGLPARVCCLCCARSDGDEAPSCAGARPEFLHDGRVGRGAQRVGGCHWARDDREPPRAILFGGGRIPGAAGEAGRGAKGGAAG